MTEQEFHTARRMFVVYGYDSKMVMIAPEKYPYTHIEWFSDLFGSMDTAQMTIDYCVRGYFLDGRMVVYSGTNFNHHVNHEDVMLALDRLSKIHEVKEIGFGAVQSKEQPWKPRNVISVPDFYRIYLKKNEHKDTWRHSSNYFPGSK